MSSPSQLLCEPSRSLVCPPQWRHRVATGLWINNGLPGQQATSGTLPSTSGRPAPRSAHALGGDGASPCSSSERPLRMRGSESPQSPPIPPSSRRAQWPAPPKLPPATTHHLIHPTAQRLELLRKYLDNVLSLRWWHEPPINSRDAMSRKRTLIFARLLTVSTRSTKPTGRWSAERSWAAPSW